VQCLHTDSIRSFDNKNIRARSYFPDGTAIDSGDWGWTNPAGGMVTTSADLAKMVKLLLRFDQPEPGLGLDAQAMWQVRTTPGLYL
jgi:CubicO group peptidase (beta-lactamase class C family)